jgi:hypothetical protein
VRRLALAAVAAATLASAGCGAGGGGGALPEGAGKTPAEAPAFVSLNTGSSEQWETALKLAARFPAVGDVLDLDKLKQLKAAAGPEVDLVWTDFANDGNDVVGLTKPSTLAKLKAALSGEVAFTDLGGGWVAVAGDRARLDRFTRIAGGDKLDGDKEFKDAFGKLDADAVVRTWVRGGLVQAALDRALASGGAAPRLTHELGDLRALAGFARAEAEGAALEVDGLIDPTPDPATFTPSLPDSVPGGALLYVSTTHLDDPTKIMLRLVGKSLPNFDTQLEQVQGVLGVTLDKDIYPLLSGESALAVYNGGRIPPILFLQKIDDENKADGLLRRFSAIAQLAGGTKAETVQIAGKSVQKLTFTGAGVTVWDGVGKGKLFVTNAADLARQAISGPDQSLADDSRFRSARDAAGLPDEVSAFAYADLQSGLPYAFRLVEQSGDVVPPETRANTKPLEAALVYLRKDGNRLRISGFVTIK